MRKSAAGPPPQPSGVVVSVCRRSKRLATVWVSSMLFVAVLGMSAAAAWVERRIELVLIMAPFLLVIAGVVVWGLMTYKVSCRIDVEGVSGGEIDRRWTCRWIDAQSVGLLGPLWSEEPFLAVRRREVASTFGSGQTISVERRARSLGWPAGTRTVRVDRCLLGPIAAAVTRHWGRPPAWEPEYLAVDAEPDLPPDW